MQLLVIRHALAGDRETFAATGKDDDLRPITREGRRKMCDAAPAIRRLAPRIDLLATSPLVRARQTAEIIAAAYTMPIGATIDELRPDARFPAFARWAARQDPDSTIAIVGHEPHLTGLVTWLTSGAKDPALILKKGAACLLSGDGPLARANAKLACLLQPDHLRAYAKSNTSVREVQAELHQRLD